MSTATTDPEITIVIPHYNDVVRLELCLAALMKNDLTGAEVLVVDNNSPEPPTRLHNAFPQVRFLTEAKKGAGPARNHGVAESSAPVLAFIDADCVPAPDWVATARRVAPTADLIGGRVDVHDETPAPRSGAEAFEAIFAFQNKAYVEKKGFSVTANLVTKRNVFEDVGPFKVDTSEDADWCQRALQKGYRLTYTDELCVSHPSRQDWVALRKKWQRLTTESFKFCGTSLAARYLWGMRALAMPASILVDIPKMLLSRQHLGFGERIRGAWILGRLRLTRMVWMLRQVLSTRSVTDQVPLKNKHEGLGR